MVLLSILLIRIDFSALGQYGYAGVFGLALAGNATVVLPAPAFITVITAARTLNPWLVGLLSGLGAGLGESTGYLAGRSGKQLLGSGLRLQRISAAVERWGAWAVLLFAAIPNPLMDIAGITAGLLRMPFWKFLLACSAGKVLRFTLLALSSSYILGG